MIILIGRKFKRWILMQEIKVGILGV